MNTVAPLIMVSMLLLPTNENVISLFQTDSIIYSSGQSLQLHIDTLNSEFLPEIIPSQLDSVVSDTIFYSQSEESFSSCAGASLSRLSGNSNLCSGSLSMNIMYFNNTNPPYLQYPLTVGSTWNTGDSLYTVAYEVIGEETIPLELKDGTIVNMLCLIIAEQNLKRAKIFTTHNSVYYYLSSIGLVKSSATAEDYRIVQTGEDTTLYNECTLIDYYMAD